MANSDWLYSGHMATSEPLTVAEGCDSPTNQLRVTVDQEICWGGFRLGVRSRLPEAEAEFVTGQCRGYGFDPWFGKIPHAMGQLSLCTMTAEPEKPQLLGPESPRACAPQEKPLR